MDQPRDSSAAARWNRLASDRREEMRRLSEERNALEPAFWDRRADRYDEGMKRTKVEDDPLLRRLRRWTDSSSTVIDVGAGTGRFAVALAPGVAHVTAVDPSDGMLAIARRDAEASGVGNLTTVHASWEEAQAEPADVAFSAFVLPLVPDVLAFVTKLDAVARERAVLYLGAYANDAIVDPLWRHFHGTPRLPGPSHLDALAVLDELGITAHVTPVEIPNPRRFATIEEAAVFYREALLVPDEPEANRQLERLLANWLMGRKGAFRSPLQTVPAAIVHWRPR